MIVTASIYHNYNNSNEIDVPVPRLSHTAKEINKKNLHYFPYKNLKCRSATFNKGGSLWDAICYRVGNQAFHYQC